MVWVSGYTRKQKSILSHSWAAIKICGRGCCGENLPSLWGFIRKGGGQCVSIRLLLAFAINPPLWAVVVLLY